LENTSIVQNKIESQVGLIFLVSLNAINSVMSAVFSKFFAYKVVLYGYVFDIISLPSPWMRNYLLMLVIEFSLTNKSLEFY